MKKILGYSIVALAMFATSTTVFGVDIRNVPDSGSSIALLTLASAGLFGVRSFLKRK